MTKYAIGGLVVGIIIGLIIIYFYKQNQNKKSAASGQCFDQCYTIEKKPFMECANKCKQLLK